MTRPNSLQRDDAAVATALRVIDDHRSFLNQQLQTGQRIKDEVAANFVSGASSTFQGKVDEWVEVAQGVVRAFDILDEDLRGANNSLDSGVENAFNAANSWSSGSDVTFSKLTG